MTLPWSPAMRVGDVFRDADVVSIDELRAARQAAVVRDDDDGGGRWFINFRTALMSKAMRLSLCGSARLPGSYGLIG